MTRVWRMAGLLMVTGGLLACGAESGERGEERPSPGSAEALGVPMEPPPSSVWPDDVETLGASTAAFASVDECLEDLRTRTPTAVAEGHMNDNRLGLTGADIRFTRSKDDNTVFAILMDWPGDGQEVDIKALGSDNETRKIKTVTLLGHDGQLTWKQDKDALEVTLPNGKPCEHAFSLKIMLGK